MIRISAITKAQLRQNTLIGTVLSHFHGVKEAKQLENIASKALHEHPIVSFGRKVDGHIAYGHEIIEATLEHARIRVSPKDAAPEYRYFKRIHASDGTKVKAGEGHGFSASAWGEIDTQGNFLHKDGKCDLRVCYPGYPRHHGSAQTKSMLTSVHGEFHQVREVGPFLDETMAAAKAMKLPDVGGVINTSWSMGAPNALASNLYFKHRKIPTAAILGDAWKSSAAVQNIAMRKDILRPLFNGSHAETLRYSQPELRRILAEDVISVYPAERDKAGNWIRTSMTAPGPAKVKVPLFGAIQRFPLAEKLGATPFGAPVGQVVHLDAKNMEVLERERILGDTHHRTNAINHLAVNDAGILHDIPQVDAGKRAGHSVV